MRKLRIAVAGAGLIGRTHIDLIVASDACELVAVADPAGAGAIVAGNVDVPCFASLEALLSACQPDGVILATPNALHVPQGMHCLERGVPVLIEKPLASDLISGERLCRLAQSSLIPVLVGHHRAHSPTMAAARRLVHDGVLGDVVAVTGTALFYKPDDYFDASPWRRQAGGGPILINLVHEIGNLCALCGDIAAVQAITSNVRRRFPVEDSVAITLRFASGALGCFLLSDTAASARSWEQTSREDPAYPAYPDEDCYHIAGTRGSLSVPSMRLKTFAVGQTPSWWTPFECTTQRAEPSDPLALQLSHFCDVIRGDAVPLVSARDGLNILRATQAIGDAARSGQLIPLEPSP